jgi:hypothetical protein
MKKLNDIDGPQEVPHGIEILGATRDIIQEQTFRTMQKIGNELMAEITAPKFTVRGEHNVWHVYKNDERLEPPFRNEERAKIERIYHERSHAIRNERK